MTSQSEHLWQEVQRRNQDLEDLRAERDRLKSRLVDWSLAFQSLTPGGSEFQSPGACEAHVRERLYRGHDLAKKVVRLKRERDRLRKAFRHTHVSGPDGDLDTCRKCGLDLRDPVHRREEG